MWNTDAAWFDIALVGTGFAACVHLVWLPRQGVNGWTGERRERYLALVRDFRLRDLWRSGR